MLNGFDQERNYTGNSGARVLVGIEPSAQFLADSQAAQAGFGGGPEQVPFSGEMSKDSDLANPSQPRDLMRAAGGETLAGE
jgi:hypothetical protein